MAIFSKSVDAAQTAVSKAEDLLKEWESKAINARAEAERLDNESGAAILADESAADTITLKIHSWERKARAFDQAAEEARRKLTAARHEALEAEAREEDKEGTAGRRKAEAHNAKVAALVHQLEVLDECDWGRAPAKDPISGELVGSQRGIGHRLATEAERHEIRAASIRHFLETGRIPNDYFEINEVTGTTFNTSARILNEGDNIPASLYVARNAGLSFLEA
ncbi:hypothetical protein GU243_06135 [Pseudarthrobacter psychrotolerans]|uniref:Uncharacterized protein n=1 Tax=Pseudarthrobacter psychrotolerans TaxID=2697569 RepID=A0A6P1NRK0_9MICC|nr:hypothetical protein [Pseudarthrobacter psychrotolerans]QHK19391.1 hypothetical protein GU243_06135 [Pseudarthrobacter psychrotolerans]